MGIEDSFVGSGSQELLDSYAVRVGNNNDNTHVEDEDTATTSRSKIAVSSYLTPWIMRSKMVVFLALIISAACVGYSAWFVLSEDETKDFETQFQSDANQVLESSASRGQALREALTTMTSLVASFARYQGTTTFPNFTMPDFEAFGQQTMHTTGIQLLAYSPLVNPNNRIGWEAYAVEHVAAWWTESHSLAGTTPAFPSNAVIVPYIYQQPGLLPDTGPGPFLPVWQLSPPPVDPSIINFNLLQDPVVQRLVDFATWTGQTAVSEVLQDGALSELLIPFSSSEGGDSSSNDNHPQSILVTPVNFEDVVVGHVVAVIPWQAFLANILQDGRGPVFVVMRDSCGTAFTYSLARSEAIFLGLGDFHNANYNDMVETVDFMGYKGDLTESGIQNHCQYTMEVYPSKEMEDNFTTNQPLMFMTAVVCVFIFASLIFIVYDKLMQRQQQRTMSTAMRATSIVRSLFPHNVAEKLQAQKAEEQRSQQRQRRNRRRRTRSRDGSEDDSEEPNQSEELVDSKPLAELFPSATVLFADIAGFTAWSSSREPEQVFVLLENLYRAFDKIAVRRKVFKVETIGDCYVAVCGLPTPCLDHAITMCRFAVEMREKFKELRCKLEVKLGPDTGDLDMRVGLHSGPVTAGVLRGDRARFQLFGDTVNTASRMESNGQPDRIHMSADTAEHLRDSGKGSWITPRKDKITAKGKGELETFWLLTREKGATPKGTGDEANEDTQNSTEHNKDDLLVSSAPVPELVVRNEKFQRMIDWNSDILLQMLCAVVGTRSTGYRFRRSSKLASLERLEMEMGQDSVPFDEVGDPPALPPDFVAGPKDTSALEGTEIDPSVAEQLHEYVTVIASMYRDNPFHNFEHASHVSMSAVKLLSRVVGPIRKRRQGVGSDSDEDLSSELNPGDNSYGITSDPLTQFTVVLAGLIHDVDHRGVPNQVLSREEPSLAVAYKNRSLAEQNSFDVAWRVLMGDDFRELRHAIYTTPAELRRFRQILVNTVLATDLFDDEMAKEREERWGTAFVPSGRGGMCDSTQSAVSCRDSMASTATVHYFRANVVLEYLIQASDVSHTMQHWVR